MRVQLLERAAGINGGSTLKNPKIASSLRSPDVMTNKKTISAMTSVDNEASILMEAPRTIERNMAERRKQSIVNGSPLRLESLPRTSALPPALQTD